jgi:hypothetical protein
MEKKEILNKVSEICNRYQLYDAKYAKITTYSNLYRRLITSKSIYIIKVVANNLLSTNHVSIDKEVFESAEKIAPIEFKNMLNNRNFYYYLIKCVVVTGKIENLFQIMEKDTIEEEEEENKRKAFIQLTQEIDKQMTCLYKSIN